MATIQGPKGLVRRNSVRKFGQVMQVMKISPFFGVRKNAGWDLLPTSNQSLCGKRSVWSDSWGPPELFVEVEGTEVIFHFDPKLNGRFHHLISSWRDAKTFTGNLASTIFQKTPSCELQVTWILEDKTLLSMEWSLIQHSLERKPQWPQPINPSRLLESLFACLDFFLGPQWSIKNRHVAAVFCIFAWNHPSHFAVNTSHKSTAVVLPRSSKHPRNPWWKPQLFFKRVFHDVTTVAAYFSDLDRRRSMKNTLPMILLKQSQAFSALSNQNWDPCGDKWMPSFAEKKDCFRDRNCWTSIILGKLCYYRWKSCNNRDPLQHQHAANSTPTIPAWIADRSLIAICRLRDSRIVAQPLLPVVP